MPNFVEPNTVDFPQEVALIEPGDLVVGGSEDVGPNRLAKPLVYRTRWLYEQVLSFIANSQNLIIGEDVQAWDVILDNLSALTGDGLLRKEGNDLSLVSSWVNPAAAGGRLSLVSGQAYDNADVTGDRVFYTPYVGDVISLFQSNEWRYESFQEKSFPLSGVASNKNLDIFFNASNGNLSASEWTSDNTRADALTRRNGVFLKSADQSQRYVGTVRTSASGEASDTDQRRFVWNAQNRETKLMKMFRGSASWTNSNPSWRPINSDTSRRLQLVAGLSVGVVDASVLGAVNNSGRLGIQHNSIVDAIEEFGYGEAAPLSQSTTVGSQVIVQPSLGFNFLQAMERAPAGTSVNSNIESFGFSARWSC